MQKLVAIASAAVAVIAGVVYFGRSSEPTSASASEPEQSPPPPIQEAPIAPTPKPIAQLQTFTPPPPADLRNAHRAAASLTKKEQQQLAACDAAWQRKAKGEQAARDAESKDPAWAYRMEQKLREYTARRFQTIPIEVTSIDCKTTFCELRAQSFSPEAATELTNAMNALVMQPPADFRGMSYSNTDEAGKAVHVVQLKRLQERAGNGERLSAEQEACWKLSGLQQERERAARDAEPRDAGWADPMEQLLRQHITEKMVKHPLDRLEITCRATFCEIKASGVTPQSQAAFQKISQEAGAEPWADMETGEGGSSMYGDGNKWEASQTLYRQESG
jgi:hypothetical protein